MAQEFLGGEWRKDGAKDRAQWEGRCHFLRAVERFRATLRDLAGTPLEAFKDAYEKTRPPPRKKPPRGPEGIAVTVQDDPEWVRWRFENDDWDDLNDQDPLVMALHEEIRAWGERWNLSWGKRRKRVWVLRRQS